MHYNQQINENIRDYITEALTLLDGYTDEKELTNKGMLYCVRCAASWLQVAASTIAANLSDCDIEEDAQ